MTSQISHRWWVAFGYVALIYFTLEIIRIPTQFLRAHNLLRLSLALLYGLCYAATLVYFWRRQQERWKYGLVTLIFLIGFAIAKSHLKTPEEAIHFFEYGLVGILFSRALEQHRLSPIKIFFLALIIASLCGWVDEILQGLSPTRTYDMNDVVLNAISSFFGLCVHTLAKNPTK